jgi:hypothetical protein
VNLLNAIPVRLPNFSSEFLLLFRWPRLLPVHMYSYISHSTFVVSLHKLLYFSFFSAFLCVTFPSSRIATSNSMHVSTYYYYSISFNTPDT